MRKIKEILTIWRLKQAADVNSQLDISFCGTDITIILHDSLLKHSLVLKLQKPVKSHIFLLLLQQRFTARPLRLVNITNIIL